MSNHQAIGWVVTLGTWASCAAGQALPEVPRLPIPPASWAMAVVGEDRVDLLVHRDDLTEVWRTNGTAGGTRKLADVGRGAEGFALGETLVCVVPRDERPNSLVAVGDDEAQEIGEVSSMMPPFAVSLGRRLIISVGGGVYSTEGTARSTLVLRDPPAVFQGPLPILPGPNPSTAVFVHTGALWVTDGTPKGTRLIKRLPPAPNGPPIPPMLGRGGGQLDGKALFTMVQFAPEGQTHLVLCATDGTAAGTRVIHPDADPGPYALFLMPIAVWKGQAYMAVLGEKQGLLVAFDTKPNSLKTIRKMPSRPPREGQFTWGEGPNIVALSKGMLFTHDAGRGRLAVWTSDGTAAGTKPLDAKGPDDTLPTIVSDGQHAAFCPSTEPRGQSPVWVSDGSPEGTRQIAEQGHPLAVHHGWVYLWLPDHTIGVLPLVPEP